jgi:hypothetical protein
MSQSQLTSFDQKLLDSAEMRVQPKAGVSKIVKFQFPPKITSESNSAGWKPEDTQGYQPIQIHTGSSGRAIEVEWEYIATDNVFTPEFIALQLRNLKTYFFEFKFGGVGTYMPVIAFKYTAIMPSEIKCRVTNASITYGPELVMQGGKYYPLYSKAAVSLVMHTQGAGDGKPPTQKFATNLAAEVKPEWY